VNIRPWPELYFVLHFTGITAAWSMHTQWSFDMPTERALARARKDQRQGKSASTQAGEFVREEIERIREGAHGARSPEQAIAIGLSQARRAGIDVPAQKGAKTSKSTRKKPVAKKRATTKAVSAKRSRATLQALKRESTASASHDALSRHARKAAAARTPAERSATAKKAARTKGPAVRKAAAKKAAATGASSRAAGAVRAARARAMRSRAR
jgi:hypothetical protein